MTAGRTVQARGGGAAAGGDGGFDELFARERAPMVRVAYLITGSRAQAEEIAHDAFATVYERWDRLDAPGAYLRRCVVNAAVGETRRRRRGAELTLVAQAAAPTAEAHAYDHTLDAVLRLEPRARALVVLRYYAQLSQEEIADVLQVPTGTVKSGLHRALARLREALA